jgi:AraC family transcriptional regulator
MSEQLTAIYAAIGFIESHLRDDVSVADIAAAAGYSLYHFIRTFNQTVHHTPYDYLMRRRLSESARELLTSQRRILDIAIDYQFNNHETFSRAFKRMFGVQPSQWRSRGVIPYRSLLPSLTLEYLAHINQGGISQPQITERKTTHLSGLMSQGQENVPGLWQNLRQILDSAASPGKPYAAYGVHTTLQNKDLFYFAGVEVLSLEVPTPPLVTLTLPPGPYVQFNHKGGKGTRSLSLDYIYQTWLAKIKNKPSFTRQYFPETDPTKQANITSKNLFEVDCFGNQFLIKHKPIKRWMISVPLNM